MKKYIFSLLSILLIGLSSCEGILYTVPNDTIIVKGDLCNISMYQVIDGNLKKYSEALKGKEERSIKDFYEGIINIQNGLIDTSFSVKREVGKTVVFDVKKNLVEKTVYTNP